MLVKNRRQLFYYKLHNVDIWGDLKNSFLNDWSKKLPWKKVFKDKKLRNWLIFLSKSLKITLFKKRVQNFFLNKFEERLVNKYKKKTRYFFLATRDKINRRISRKLKLLMSLRITLLFFIVLKHRHFKLMSKKAKKQDGFYEENYLLLLEGRLVSIVYRSTMVLDMFEAIDFVKKANVWVCGAYISYINYLVPIMKWIGFRYIYKGFLCWNFLIRIRRKNIKITIPKYIYFSYVFFSFFLKRFPRKSDLINPFGVDMFRAVGYAGFAK